MRFKQVIPDTPNINNATVAGSGIGVTTNVLVPDAESRAESVKENSDSMPESVSAINSLPTPGLASLAVRSISGNSETVY